jgi:hypothetical protein
MTEPARPEAWYGNMVEGKSTTPPETQTPTFETIGAQIESTRTITPDQLKILVEMGIHKLPNTDRNFVVSLKERNIDDKSTSNERRRRDYVETNLQFNTGELTYPDDQPISRRLVSELTYFLVTMAKWYAEEPENSQFIIQRINQEISHRDNKQRSIQSGQHAIMTKRGIPNYPNDDALKPEGLRIIWDNLVTCLSKTQLSE